MFLMWNPDSDVSFVSTVISHVRNDKLIIPLSSGHHIRNFIIWKKNSKEDLFHLNDD